MLVTVTTVGYSCYLGWTFQTAPHRCERDYYLVTHTKYWVHTHHAISVLFPDCYTCKYQYYAYRKMKH